MKKTRRKGDAETRSAARALFALVSPLVPKLHLGTPFTRQLHCRPPRVQQAPAVSPLPSCLRAFLPSCGIFGAWLLTAVPARAQSPAPTPELAPIAPPVYVFPYPPWMVAAAAVAAIAVLGALAWAVVRRVRNRPVPPPPTPRQRALAALEALRLRAEHTEPYPFSIEVSDALRRFVSEEFRVRATQQTSPEFLAAAAASPQFSEAGRALLAAFLEKADLIKFARVAASSKDSGQLLEEARRFVEGGAAR